MQDREPEDFRESDTLKHIWALFREDRIALFSFYALLVLILTALFSPLIAPYSAEMQFIPLILSEKPSALYLLSVSPCRYFGLRRFYCTFLQLIRGKFLQSDNTIYCMKSSQLAVSRLLMFGLSKRLIGLKSSKTFCNTWHYQP